MFAVFGTMIAACITALILWVLGYFEIIRVF